MAELVDIVDDAHAALVKAADLIDDLVDGECAAALRSLQRIVSTAQELQRRVMDRAVLRGEWSIDGFRSPARWAAVNAAVPERTARRLRQQASSFRDLPHASAAALHGDLHDVYADEIARCHRSAPHRFDDTIDSAFTTVACTGDLAAFASAVREWRTRVDAEAAADADQPVPPDRGSLHLSESIEGRWFGDLELGPEDGRFVASAIDRGVGRMLQAKRDGDPAAQDLSIAAMRAQALVDLVDRALRLNPRRPTAPDRYHVAFTFDYATYTEAAALLAQQRSDSGRGACPQRQIPLALPSPPADRPDLGCGSPRGGTGRWQAGGAPPPWPREPIAATGDLTQHDRPAHPPDARPRLALPADALCDCSIYRLVVGAQSEVLDIGRAQRNWPAPMRNAIARRDGGCRYPYCTEPIAHCDVHHCTHWEHGGHTAIANGVALCRFHHTFIHSQRWTVELDAHQHPTFIRPDGTTYPPVE